MKSIILLLITLPLCSYAFFSSKLSNNTQDKLRDHILNGKESEFIKLWGDSSEGQYLGHISSGLGHYFLGRLTSRENWDYSSQKKLKGKFICFPNAVKHLISKGATPSENTKLHSGSAKIKTGHLTGALNNLCPKSAKLIINKLSPKEIAATAMKWKLSNFVQYSNDKIYAPKLIEIARVIGKKNKSLCIKSNANCQAVAHIKQEFVWLEQHEKDKAFYATKKGQKQLTIEKACFYHQQYLGYLGKINEEKERGKISGYVNASNLKEWGDKAYTKKKERNKFLKKAKLTLSTDPCK